MRIAIYLVMWAFSSGYATLSGGRSERAGAAILLWINIGTLLIQHVVNHGPLHFSIGGLLVDGLIFPACLALALKTNRQWTLWFCAAQLTAVFGHLVHFALSGETWIAFSILTRVPAYIQCLALIAGTYFYQKTGAQKAEEISSRS